MNASALEGAGGEVVEEATVVVGVAPPVVVVTARVVVGPGGRIVVDVVGAPPGATNVNPSAYTAESPVAGLSTETSTGPGSPVGVSITMKDG